MWFYAKDGNQRGPVPDDVIADLIRKGEIKRGTKVWKEGFSDWKKIEDTELSKYLSDSSQASNNILNNPTGNIEENPAKFCTNCGAKIDAKAEVCPKCGVRQIVPGTANASQNTKTIMIAMASILAIVVALSVGYILMVKHKTSKNKSQESVNSNPVQNNYASPTVANNKPQPPTTTQYPPPPSTYNTPQSPQDQQYQQTPTQTQPSGTNANEIAAIDLVLENYYSNIPTNLIVSYKQLSPERRATMSFDSWASGYGTTLYDKLKSIKVLDITPDYAKVLVYFESKDIADNGGNIVKEWEGTWTLVKENNRWYLDRSDIRLVKGYYMKPLN